MRRVLVNLVALTALLTGFYLSARYFSEPVDVAQPVAAGALVGGVRPDFNLESNKGRSISPADFSGKALLINFWATWCGPCRQEMPMLMDLQRQYGSDGFQIVGIALDDARAASKFVQTFGITYPILLGLEDVFETSLAYGNGEGVLPYSVLVDKNGIVRWQHAGIIKEEKITSLLSDLL